MLLKLRHKGSSVSRPCPAPTTSLAVTYTATLFHPMFKAAVNPYDDIVGELALALALSLVLSPCNARQ